MKEQYNIFEDRQIPKTTKWFLKTIPNGALFSTKMKVGVCSHQSTFPDKFVQYNYLITRKHDERQVYSFPCS